MSVEYIERAAKACKIHNEACDRVAQACKDFGQLSMEAEMASIFANLTKANRDKAVLENRRFAMEQVNTIALLAFDNVEDFYDLIDFARRGYLPAVKGT